MISKWKVFSFHFTSVQYNVFVSETSHFSRNIHFQLSIIDFIHVNILDTDFIEKTNMDMELNEQTFHYDSLFRFSLWWAIQDSNPCHRLRRPA